jgi:2-polyprenyl-3-methyl-5-hydroxy-6-metoxy-1,4-benzoquinol methylase
MISGFEYVPCPKCGCPSSSIVVKGKDYLYGVSGEYSASECQNCKFWFQNPRPTPDRLASLYPADYLPHVINPPAEAVSAPSQSRAASYLRRSLGYAHLNNKGMRPDWRTLRLFDMWRKWTTGVNLIPHYLPDSRLLEIGCGNGARLIILRSLDWQSLYGIELVPAAVEQARKGGFLVERGFVEDVLDTYPQEFFDVVITSMVLEHLYNPFQVVRQVAAKLKPGGQFLFSTISRDALDARLYGSYWAGFDFPRHMVYLRKQDIYAMLAEEFEHIECFHQAAPIDFVRSSTWREQGGYGTPFDRWVLAFAESRSVQALHVLLAWLGLTCRVSFRCQKKRSGDV